MSRFKQRVSKVCESVCQYAEGANPETITLTKKHDPKDGFWVVESNSLVYTVGSCIFRWELFLLRLRGTTIKYQEKGKP